MSVEPHS